MHMAGEICDHLSGHRSGKPANSLILHESDNVAVVVAAEGLLAGATLIDGTVVGEIVACGHKVAIRDISPGAGIYKFGHKIAVASRAIKAGDWVHRHNVEMPTADQISQSELWKPARKRDVRNVPQSFRGYKRNSGVVGTRNHIAVASTVNCSATVVKAICRYFCDPNVIADLAAKGIDGVVPVTHGAGCAQAIGGENHSVLNRAIAGTVFHPNVVGTLFVELGCEGTTSASILDHACRLRLDQNIPTRTIGIQSSGGSAAAIKVGVEAVSRIISDLPPFSRSEVPISDLKIALNCGGSDAFSSITANPLLGMVSDLVVELGGTVVLAEIPECHGVETLLRARSQSFDVVQKLDDVFSWWQKYAIKNNCTLNNNLAPGNVEGGITTIIEKSLGAVAKAGTSAFTDVVGYAMPIRSRGAVLMNTPGFDPVSVTGLIAGGCNLVTFTTGRGSVFGSATVPTVKIATNTSLFERMAEDMDFDAGAVLSGEWDREVERLYEFIIATASGAKTASERQGMGWEEFVVWSVGETL
jgi:altronate dehydratase